MTKAVSGFSKLTKIQKIEWLVKNYLNDQDTAISTLKKYWNEDEKLQQLHDEFIENTVSNFYLPLGLAPNFLIDPDSQTIVHQEPAVPAPGQDGCRQRIVGPQARKIVCRNDRIVVSQLEGH